MNISHKNLFNNNFSKEKRQFYEKIGNRYNHAYLKFQKKYPDNKDFRKKVINWLFSKDEDTRMILCSVENKKYSKLINEAYNQYLEDNSLSMYLTDDEDDEKARFYYLNNNRLSNNDYDYNIKIKQFFNDIMFYQCESPINDYDKYGNYFTLNSNVIKSQSSFNIFYKTFTNDNFLKIPIKIKRDEQNKISNNLFLFPEWLIENNISKDVNKNLINYYKPKINIAYYYSLPKFILALLEQVISIRYIIYNEANNLQEILPTIYLYELFEKRNKIILYLTPKETKFSFLYLYKIDELIKNLYNDSNLEIFISKYNKKNEGIFFNEFVYFNIDDNLDDIIKSLNSIFSNIFKGNTPKDFINFFMFIKIEKIFTYDDFLFRGIFEKIYESYSNQAYKDLIFSEENTVKKRKKKKKKHIIDNTNYENNVAVNQNNDNKTKNDNDKNNNIINEKINNNDKIINYGEELLKILSESNLKENKKEDILNISKKNIDINKEEKNNDSTVNLGNSNILKKKENQSYDYKIKDIKRESKKDEEQNSLIYDFIKNIIYENLFHQIDNKENSNNIKNRKKQKNFFLYETTKNNKKKKKNEQKYNNQINEEFNKIDNDKSDEKKINNKDNKDIDLIDKLNENKDNKNYHKEIINLNKEINYNIQNNIEENNNIDLNNKINISVPSHINSLTFSSSKNQNKEQEKQNIIINNNIINIQNNIINQENIFMIHNNSIFPFEKLHNNIIEYNNDLEEFLFIQRKIKEEITKYLSEIINNLFPDSKLSIYGSSLYHLDIDTSDLDLSISTESKISLSDLEKYLIENNNNNQFNKIDAILSASVPIIKLEIDFLKMNNDKIKDLYKLLLNTKYYNKYYNFNEENEIVNKMNKINIDISLNSAKNEQLEFIKNVLKLYPEIKPLIKIIKKLLQLRDMNNSYKGGMSSYCLFLLIYSYIKIYYNKENENIINNVDYGSLLIEFLFYYITYIDFKCTIIAPYLINPFIIKCPLDVIPTIIEPISKKNAGKNIYKIFDVIDVLSQIYEDIFIIMKDYNEENIIYQLIKKYSQK